MQPADVQNHRLPALPASRGLDLKRRARHCVVNFEKPNHAASRLPYLSGLANPHDITGAGNGRDAPSGPRTAIAKAPSGEEASHAGQCHPLTWVKVRGVKAP